MIDYTGGCQASSVTYFHASLLGKGDEEGEVVYALGQYQDRWVMGKEGWRIGGRNLVYMVCLIFPSFPSLSFLQSFFCGLKRRKEIADAGGVSCTVSIHWKCVDCWGIRWVMPVGFSAWALRG